MGSREQFEKWAIEDAATQNVVIAPRRNGAWYFEDGESSYLNTAWAAWQGSRKALVVDLRGLGWAPCVLQEAVEAADLQEKWPC